MSDTKTTLLVALILILSACDPRTIACSSDQQSAALSKIGVYTLWCGNYGTCGDEIYRKTLALIDEYEEAAKNLPDICARHAYLHWTGYFKQQADRDHEFYKQQQKEEAEKEKLPTLNVSHD